MKDLTNGNEAGLIVSFSVPMLIGNVFQQSYNLVDSIIVGRFIGKYALGAVGASFPILFLLISLIIGVTMGFSILISQYFGAKDIEKVRRTIDTTYVFIFYATLVVTVVGILFSEPILKLLKTPEEILPQGVTFLRITFGGMVFIFGYNSLGAILRGLGDSKTPLYFLIFSSLLNIVLVLLFVAGLGWGIAGSAWATVIAQAVSFALCVAYLNRTHKVLRFRVAGIVFDRAIFKRSLAIGFPVGIEHVLIAAGMMALTRIVNGFGADAIAAFTAASRLDTFAIMPAITLSAAISTFVGQNLGAGKMERVRHGLRTTLMISAAVSIATTLVVVLFGRPLISLFNTDPRVVSIGVRYLVIVGCFYIVFSSMFVFTGALNGAGDTVIPMLVAILSLWIIRIPVSAWMAGLIGTDGIWWGAPISWIVGLAFAVAYYSTGRWKQKVAVRVPLQ
jgi:putative MATE family efflux protein